MTHKSIDSTDRRDFLKTTGTVGAGTAVAVLLPGVANAAAQVSDGESKDEKKGYQTSQHVLDYYRAARI